MPRSVMKSALDPSRLRDCQGCGASFYPPDHKSKAGEHYCTPCTKAGRHHKRFQYTKSLLPKGETIHPPRPVAQMSQARSEFQQIVLDVSRLCRLGKPSDLLAAETTVRRAFRLKVISDSQMRALWEEIDNADSY